MTLVSLPSLAMLAAGFLAALFLLPGLVLKAVAAANRLRGRRVETPAILGPLFWHELVTVTRRGSQVRLRAAYAIVLLVGLLAAYLREFSNENPIRLLFGPGSEFPRERVTAFAQRYFHIFLFCQLIALMLVAPVFAGGSLTEEKDRGTLEFLRASLLSSREIVLGKLAARVLFVLGLAFTGLPVLAIALHFGGVDPVILAISFVAAAVSTTSLAAFSFWQATCYDTLKAVLLFSYAYAGTLLVLGGCCLSCIGGWGGLFAISPFSLLIASLAPWPFRSFDPIEATMLHVAIHGTLAIVFATLAIGNVRSIPSSQCSPVPDAPSARRWVEVTAEPATGEVRREQPTARFVRVPTIDDDDPFLWKELHFGGRLPSFERDALRGCGLSLLVASGLPIVFGVLVSAVWDDRPQDVLNPVYRLASVAMVVLIVPLAGLRVVGGVALERQKCTLESLFSLPVERRVLLDAKGRAAFHWLRIWASGYAAVVILMLLAGGVNLASGIVVGLAIAAASRFFLALSLWLSVRCLTVVRATTWYLAVSFAAFLLPPMLAVLASGAVELAGGPSRLSGSLVESLSLPFGIEGVGELAESRRHLESRIGSFLGTLLMSAIFVLLSFGLRRDAARRFEREGT